MLTIEQFKHTEAGKAYHAAFINGVLDFEVWVFSDMMEKGYFRKGDPEVMAIEFYTPFFLVFARFDGSPEREEELLGILERHMTAFAAQHAIKREVKNGNRIIIRI